jgi:phosphoglycerate dehydrogenase-like enzyme
MSFKMVILPPVHQQRWAERIREAVAGVEAVLCADQAAAHEAIADAEAAFGTVPRELLNRARRLRWIQAPAAGPPAGWYYPELIEHPVVITNFRGIYNDHLGMHILSFVLAFARGFQVYLPQQQRREWRPGAPIVHLPDATALLVGVGGIGGEAARLLAAFGTRVVAVDPRQTVPPAGVAALHGVERLDDLLPVADFVIITAPETPATQGLFNAARLARMKPSAFLINVSRGAIVVLDELAEAVRTRAIAGAGLDVYQVEPLPADHPLWTLPGVLMTPHVGGEGPYLDERRAEVLQDNCRRFAAGRPLRNLVDKRSWF